MKSPSRLLPVLSPYAEQIVKGEKVWELRSTNTQVRERVGIALVGTKKVIGDVRVVDSREVSRDELCEYQDLHRVTPESIERMFSVKKNALLGFWNCRVSIPIPCHTNILKALLFGFNAGRWSGWIMLLDGFRLPSGPEAEMVQTVGPRDVAENESDEVAGAQSDEPAQLAAEAEGEEEEMDEAASDPLDEPQNAPESQA